MRLRRSAVVPGTLWGARRGFGALGRDADAEPSTARGAYNGTGDGAPVLSKTTYDPWQHGPTASRNRNGVVVEAYAMGVSTTTVKTALDGDRGWRTTTSTRTFDYDDGSANPTGRVTRTDDAGDVTTTADDRCTRLTYAVNTARHMLTYAVETETVRSGVPPPRTGRSTSSPGRGRTTTARPRSVPPSPRATRPAWNSSPLNTDGAGYLTSYELFDALLRARQTRAPAVGGGSIVTDTLYDSSGLVGRRFDAYFAASASSGSTGPPRRSSRFRHPLVRSASYRSASIMDRCAGCPVVPGHP